MKKTILLIILFFNLIPVLKEGKIEFTGAFKVMANEDYSSEFGGGCVQGGGYTYAYAISECEIEVVNCTTSADCETGEIYNEECSYTTTTLPNCGADPYPSTCEELGMIDSYCGCVYDISECETEEESKDCANVPGGSATTDDCGTCVGGNTGKTTQIWYKDNDNDTWGNSSNTKNCYNPGSGWVTRGGDLNDNCYSLANDAEQCCSQQDQDTGLAATNLFNNTAVQNALSNIFPTNPPPPGFPLNNESHFYLTNEGGVVGASDISYLGPYGGSPNSMPDFDDFGDLHTHPNSGNPPSAADVYRLSLFVANGSFDNFDYSFVVTANGTQYALVVTDEQLVSNFYSQNGNFVNSSTNGFNNTSTAGADYYIALSQTGSEEHALAYALKNSGISLFKQDAVTPPQTPQGFHKLDVEEKIENGALILEITDCE